MFDIFSRLRFNGVVVAELENLSSRNGMRTHGGSSRSTLRNCIDLDR